MNILPARLAFYVLLPAVLGGGLAWRTRSVTAPDAEEAAARVVETSRSAAPGAMAKTGGPADLPVDSVLAGQQRFCAQLQGADLGQMMTLLDEAQTFADAFRRRSLRNLVFEQMARTDPAGAWALLETWENGCYRNQFLQAWAQVDAEGALTWAEGQGKEGVDFAREIVTGLVPDNMAAFVKILRRLKPEQISTERVATAFRLMAADDPAGAVRLLDKLGGGSKLNTATSSLGEGWARRDAKAAYAWAKDLTDPAQRESALRGVFRAWAETDPKGTAARLDELTKDPAMAKAAAGDSPVRAVVRAWAAQDPKAAAAWLRTREENSNTGDGTDSFRDLLQSEILPLRDEWNAIEIAELIRKPGEKLVAQEDNKSADFNYSMRMGGSNEDEYRETIGQFGGYNSPLHPTSYTSQTGAIVRIANPAQAFDDLARQPGDASRQNVLHEVASQWAERDPDAARAKLKETTNPWLKLGLINALSNHARQNNDTQLAAEIAKAYPETSYQGKQLTGQVYGKLARSDPTRAQEMLNSGLDAEGKTSIAQAMVAQQASYDPAGALGWAAQQTDEKVRLAATRSAVGTWAESDAYAASEWLATQLAGPLREEAVHGLVQSLSRSSPDDALQWAGTLADPTQRANTQVGIVQNLLWQDPAKARELAAGLQLPETQREMLDQMIQHREKNGF